MMNVATEVKSELRAGAHFDVPFADYIAWPAVNWHTLFPFRISAKQGRHEMTLPPDATADMVLGGSLDCAVFDPAEFDHTYIVMPKFDGHPNSNIYKAAKAAWMAENSGRVVLTADEMDATRGMQKALMDHPTAAALLTGRGRNQISIVWTDQKTGELCKGRIDRLARVPANLLDPSATGEVVCLTDLKKTAFLHRFDSEVAKYGYHGQLGFYNDGLYTIDPRPVIPLLIVVEDHPPFDLAIFSMTDAVEHGRRLYRRLLDTLHRCKTSGGWPGICPKGTIPVVLPGYAREAEETEL
jgi:exodeoxyribonuclease VIII